MPCLCIPHEKEDNDALPEPASIVFFVRILINDYYAVGDPRFLYTIKLTILVTQVCVCVGGGGASKLHPSGPTSKATMTILLILMKLMMVLLSICSTRISLVISNFIKSNSESEIHSHTAHVAPELFLVIYHIFEHNHLLERHNPMVVYFS